MKKHKKRASRHSKSSLTQKVVGNIGRVVLFGAAATAATGLFVSWVSRRMESILSDKDSKENAFKHNVMLQFPIVSEDDQEKGNIAANYEKNKKRYFKMFIDIIKENKKRHKYWTSFSENYMNHYLQQTELPKEIKDDIFSVKDINDDFIKKTIQEWYDKTYKKYNQTVSIWKRIGFI